jgi:hypothetical protein
VNWSFVRREWGAVTFVLTVLIGMIVVPTALAFGNQSVSGSSTSSSIASTARSATPSTTASAARSATP